MPSRCILALFLLASVGGHAAEPEATGRMDIVVNAVRSDRGKVRASLYRDPGTFRKETQALKLLSVAAGVGEIRLRFEDLAPGRYAVMVYHDENGNEKLDLRFGMLPIEGYGLSRNPQVMGPPKFEDSAVEFVPGAPALGIDMRY